MSIGTIALLIAGLVALVAGAEALVRGAARLAARTGMSSVVIGLTVVAFGTSAPELAVSVGDAFRGGPEAGSIAIGNVVGSNIANILLCSARLQPSAAHCSWLSESCASTSRS